MAAPSDEPLAPPAVPTIDGRLVERLVADQFPQWADLPVAPVSPQGWDNRTFRLGDQLSARLPSAPGYAAQILKEQRWLPHLAAHLTEAIPAPVALGRPSADYPFAWSVRGWIDGQVLARASGVDQRSLGEDLGKVLLALRRVPTRGAPPAGPLTAYRGASLRHYAAEARRAARLLEPVTAGRVAEVLASAVASRWESNPVWFHGDVAADNLLVRGGRLYAVLDFGCAGVGDPACDLVIAFTSLDRDGRARLRETVALDDDTWDRARGWATWKAVITLADPHCSPERQAEQHRVLEAVMADAADGA